MKRVSLFVAVMAVVCGCSGLSLRRTTPAAETAISEHRAVVLAKKEIRKRNTDVQEIRSRAALEDGRWVVRSRFTVWYDGLGLFTGEESCRITMDGSGRVLAYRAGP